MITLDIQLNGDGCWPDLTQDLFKDKNKKLFEEAELKSVALLQAGTESGKPSVSLRIETEDGKIIIAQTTLALWLMAGDAMKARAGDPRR